MDLVIFDCDGVLVDSEILSLQGYRETLLAIGVDLPSERLLDFVGLKQEEIFRRIEVASGAKVPAAARDALWPRIRALFEASLRPTEGLVDFLASLERDVCVASSSSPERLAVSLALTGLDKRFGSAVFSTEYVARGKPAPDIYLYAAAQMGRRPGRCVVIEDAAPGVEGAVAAGMVAIGFTGGSHTRPGHADKLLAAGARATFADWRGVGEWLAETDLR